MENIAQLGIKVDSTSIKQATNELSKLTNQSGKTEKSTNALTTGFLNLKNAVIGYASIQTAKQILDTADNMNLLNARLKLATSSTAEFASQQRALLTISKQSYTSFSDTVTLFTKLNPALKQVGATTEQVNSVVASFNKGLQLGGSTAEEASSAILQFSQAMGSGALRGEEFNAINDASPKLLSYLAKGLGVAQTALRGMAENGELTSARVSNALLKVKSDIDRDFATLPVTVGKALTNLKTDLSLAVNEIDTATGATQSLANRIVSFSNSIGSMSKDIIEFYKEAKTFINENETAFNIATESAKLLLGTYLAFGATSLVFTKVTESIIAMRVAMVSMTAATPIIGAVSLAIYALSNSFIEGKTRTDNLGKSVDELAKSLGTLELKSRLVEVNKELKEMDNRFKNYSDSQKLMYQGGYDMAYKEKVKLEESIKLIEKKNTVNKDAKQIGEINGKIVRNDIELIKLSGSEYEKFNLTLAEKLVKMQSIGATEKELNEASLSANKEFNEKQNKELEKGSKKLEETQKARAEIAQIGMSGYDKSISDITAKTIEWAKAGVSKNEVLNAEIKLRNELNSQTILENLQTELSYYEKKLQLQKDSLDKELELKGVQYANNILAIESSDKTIEQKQKLIALETELYNTTIERLKADSNTEFQDTIKSFQEDSLARQIELNNAIFDFGAGFKSSNNEIMEVSKSLAAMSDASLKSKKAEVELNKKYTKEFNKYAGDVEKTKELEQQYTKDTDLLNKQAINNQILGYANIAGAISGMYKQGSKEAATFQAVQTTLALVEGTRAILTAGTGDPYTAIPRMAAMAMMVSSLLGNIGVAFGASKVSESITSDSMSSLKANTGTGTILGDTTKQSESIAKAMGILEDFAEPQFEVLQSMNKYLETIANSIGGVSRLLIQSGLYGKAFGQGFTPTSADTGWQQASITNAFNKSISKIKSIDILEKSISKIIGVDLAKTDLIGMAAGKVLSGIFGKTSTTVSKKLLDSGIYFADQLLTNARDEIYGSMYQTIQKKTTTSSKSWFSSSTSTKKKISTSMYDMEGNTELERQFSLILDSMYGATFEASKALDFTAQEITNTLDNFVVSIGKISLKGLSGDQIQERLKSVFGAIGDNLAKTAFPLLLGFQQVGEGMYTTMTRVATGMEEARFYIDRLGTATVKYTDIINQQGVVGFEALTQSIIKADEATYGLNNGVVKMIGNMSATTEELYSTYLTFGNIRDILQATNQSASNLSSSMILGAGSISALDSGTKAYMENFLSDSERLNIELGRLREEFKLAGYEMPKTRQGFIDLIKSIDTSTEAGAKAYGRLISISDSYNDTISEIEESSKSLINSLSSFVSSIRNTIQTDTTFKDFSISFNSMIDAIRLGSGDLSSIGDATIATAQSYLDTVSRTAKSSAEIEFAKKIVANKFEGVINAKDITLGTINDTLKISFNEDSVIVKALNDVKNELVYLNQLNTRQTANSNKTLQLQRASIA